MKDEERGCAGKRWPTLRLLRSSTFFLDGENKPTCRGGRSMKTLFYALGGRIELLPDGIPSGSA